MPSPFHQHPSSYRDPSGFLFYRDGVLYRQVNRCFAEDFDQFINGGLYHHLVEQQMLLHHQTVGENLTGTEQWYQTLQPEELSYVSYPYEWCFDMLKDAALLTLDAATEAMKFGMMLKDASAYNVQWHQGRMMFIDTLSFEKYDEQKPWIAYRQFCEHFFAPLALMHYLKEPIQPVMMAYADGIPLALVKKTLPLKSKWHLHTYLHLHLHASMATRSSTKTQRKKPFTRRKMQDLLRSLREGIEKFSLSGHSGVWSGYYEEANQRTNYIAIKKKILATWIDALSVETVLDAGSNEGTFSELFSAKARSVISIDLDHYAVNTWYRKIREKRLANVHPLLVDLAHPSPSIGVNNRERGSFLQRTRVDLVLALALIHHLGIGKNISFEQIAETFSSLGKRLIIEFVPRTDEKIEMMLLQKKDIYSWYTEEEFLRSFEKKFRMVEKIMVGDSGRTLYLFERHDEP